MDIIAPIVGAGIGYFTNWLAIKMLFRPYNEKRIFNIRVPFTPGLMAKERYQLSKKVGNIISEHLLTEEVMVEALISDDIHQNIEKLIDKIVIKLKNEDKNLEEILNTVFENNTDAVVEGSVNKVTDLIISEINKEGFQYKAAEFIVSYVETLLQKQVKELPFEKVKVWMDGIFKNYGKEYIESPEFENLIITNIATWSNQIDENQKTIGEIVPQDVLSGVKGIVTQKIQPLSELLLAFIEKPEIETKIKDFIMHLINENVTKLITMFVSPTKIYESILKSFKDYLKDENNYVKTAQVALEYIDKIEGMKIGEVNQKLNYNTYNLAEVIVKTIRRLSTEKNMSHLLNSISEHMLKLENKNIVDIIKDFDPDISNKAKMYLVQQIKKGTKKESLRQTIDKTIKTEVVGMMQRPIKELWQKVSLDSIVMLKKTILKIYNIVIKNAMINILEAMNISKIVENRINDLEISEAEKIVLEVAKKELGAITMIGGLLGFIIGFIPQFIY